MRRTFVPVAGSSNYAWVMHGTKRWQRQYRLHVGRAVGLAIRRFGRAYTTTSSASAFYVYAFGGELLTVRKPQA